MREMSNSRSHAGGNGTASISGHGHGWPLLRKQPGALHRTCLPGGMEGGPISAVQNGDLIEVDAPQSPSGVEEFPKTRSRNVWLENRKDPTAPRTECFKLTGREWRRG